MPIKKCDRKCLRLSAEPPIKKMGGRYHKGVPLRTTAPRQAGFAASPQQQDSMPHCQRHWEQHPPELIAEQLSPQEASRSYTLAMCSSHPSCPQS